GAPDHSAKHEAFRKKYDYFQRLLADNNRALELLSDLEGLCYGPNPFSLDDLTARAERLISVVYDLAEDLNGLAQGRYPELFDAVESIGVEVLRALVHHTEVEPGPLTLPLERLSRDTVHETGGKAANLGEIANRVNLPTPRGFAVTAWACHRFMQSAGLSKLSRDILRNLDVNDTGLLQERCARVQEAIRAAALPPELADALAEETAQLTALLGPEVRLAVRSSATSEDSQASFAGQHSTELNVRPERIEAAYKRVVASIFNPRAVFYRRSRGYPDDVVIMSVLCLNMIDARASGVLYTRDPNDPGREALLVNGLWGLGLAAVDGSEATDYFELDPDDFSVRTRRLADKQRRMTLDPATGLAPRQVPPELRAAPCLSDAQLAELGGYGRALEEHYGQPLDIEWALDQDERLFILQGRPLMLHLAAARVTDLPHDRAELGRRFPGHEVLLMGGDTACRGRAAGPAYILTSDHNLAGIPEGAVLVAPETSPRYVPALGRIRALVTEVGSVTGHMASVAREFGVPALVGVADATRRIQPGEDITVDATNRLILSGVVRSLVTVRRRTNPMKGSPAYKTAMAALQKISLLNLTDPAAANFTPAGCTTLHDVIRFAHEKSMAEMFSISDTLGVDEGMAVPLKLPLPLKIVAVDLGGGLHRDCEAPRRDGPRPKDCTLEQITSVPFRALLGGMLHKDIHWTGSVGVNWKGLASVMAETVFNDPTRDPRMGGLSYAVLSDTYMNFSSKLGYHYTTIDAYTGPVINDNYVTFSFKGGAADIGRRSRRATLIAIILKRLGLTTERSGDLVRGVIKKHAAEVLTGKLDMLGRLLGAMRLLDMMLSSDGQIEWYADQFFAGNYAFTR
ncbi:MAG: PEP/pyruvate-binding domain-containing protein, partial [Desulfovibrionaceae bacterium]